MMLDFQNSAIIEKDFLTMVKLWHVVDGIFIWEFCITLNYEWSVIRGHRPYRRTIWVYSLTRMCTLIAVILNMLGFDSSSPINCEVWVIFELIFASLSFAAASFLIVLRINRIAVAIALGAWSTNVAFLIYNITRLRVAWMPALSICEVLNTESSIQTVVTTLVTDVVLLLIMLVGLLRLRVRDTVTVFGLGQLLWKQGLISLFLATIAEVPPSVFLILNLNGPLNLMFQTPALIVMSIASTRMHRSLTNFNHTGSFDAYPTRGHSTNTDPERIFSAPPPLDRVEVVIHTSSEDYPPAKTGQYASHGPHIPENQSQDKSFVLDIRSDLENGFQ
ncbi:hypothetical protein EI94DRAFT_821028 [Lactarius quietus]|nr:hypothetical protein EI94DRAFT_821028 [Lactarius quietus]